MKAIWLCDDVYQNKRCLMIPELAAISCGVSDAAYVFVNTLGRSLATCLFVKVIKTTRPNMFGFKGRNRNSENTKHLHCRLRLELPRTEFLAKKALKKALK